MSWPLTVGMLAFIVYLTTLSRGVFPGQSAALTVFAAGLEPGNLVAHPLWSAVVQWLAHLPVLSLTLRLNVFDALCAGVAVGLFGQWVSRLIFAAACEDADGNVAVLPPRDESDKEETPAVPVESPAVAAHNRRVAILAAIGGCAAALALAFCVPFWSAATRLGFQTFDLLLVLVALHLAGRQRVTLSLAPALAAAFLCGIGCVETAVFLPLAPILFCYMLGSLLRAATPWERQTSKGIGVAALGTVLGLLLLWHVRADPATPLALRTVVGDLIHGHAHALRHALPHTCWIYILLLAFGPALAVLLTAPRTFHERSLLSCIVHAAFTVAALLCLFNVPFSPWGLLRGSESFPIMAYVAAALSAGYLVAYWQMLATTRDDLNAAHAPRNRQRAFRTDNLRRPTVFRWLGHGMSGALVVAIFLLPLLNRAEADGRRGAFMDRYAQRVLDTLGPRTWLVTDGFLDNHLRLRALATGKVLHLICLQREYDRFHLRELQLAIDRDAAFVTNRVRLKNDASLGAAVFLQEWLATDPHAAERVAIFEFADFWADAGLIPRPDRVLFTGVHAVLPEEIPELVASHLRFWDSLAPPPSPTGEPPDVVATCRRNLRRHTGLVGNALGVLLQDLGRPQEAFAVYTRVARLDPDNLSARINRYALTLAGVEPGQKEEAAQAARDGIARAGGTLNVDRMMRLYGVVRSPQAVARMGLNWMHRGQFGQAELGLRRAVETSTDATRPAYLEGLAGLLLLQDKEDQGEATYREILRQEPDNARAMAGLLRVELLRGRPEAAQTWLERLPPQLADSPDVVLQRAAIQLALKQYARACKTLNDALDKNASLVAGWALLISVLIEDGKAEEAEREILPRMQRAVQQTPGTAYLLCAARGFVAEAKGPAGLREARDNFAKAVGLHPENLGFRQKVAKLDMQLGDTEAAERQARDLLRIDRKDALGNYILGAILLARGELDAADDLLQRSLEAKVTLPALNDRAECLRRQARLPEAERLARQALVIDVRSGAAWDTLACILLDSKRAPEAEAAARQAVTLAPTNPYAQTTLVRCLAAQGRMQDARKLLAPLLRGQAHLPADLREKIQPLAATLATP